MDTVTIRTAQNVDIDYELANTSSRIGGFLLDGTIFAVAYNMLIIITASILQDAMIELLLFYGNLAFFLLYYFLMELFNRGQTLGKRIIGIKVIRLDGNDPTPADFLTRAVFLLPDVIFSLGIPAVLLVSSGRYKQRIGDIVAGTAVIHTAFNSTFTLQGIVSIRDREDHEAQFPEVQRFSDADMIVVKQALARLRRYNNPAHREAVRTLAIRLADQMGLDKAAVKLTPEQFLNVLLLDYIVLTR